MISCSLSLVVISLELYSGLLHVQNDPATSFKASAVSEWSLLSESITSMHVEVSRESFFSSNLEPLWLRGRQFAKYGFRRDTGMFTELDLEDFDNKGFSTETHHVLNISNENYRATLACNKKGEDWSLTKLKMGCDRDDLQKFREITTIPWLMICDNVSVPELIQNPDFVILNIEQLAGKDGDKNVRVRFRNDGWRQDPTKSIQCVQSGFIDFDVVHFHRILGYEVHWKDKISEGDRKGVMVYDEGKDIPRLISMVQEFPNQQSKKRGLMSSRDIITMKYSYNSRPSEMEFRLSHYGLPEPMGVPAPEKLSHTWLWLLAAAVGSVALAILFALLKRRQTLKSTTTTSAPSQRSIS